MPEVDEKVTDCTEMAVENAGRVAISPITIIYRKQRKKTAFCMDRAFNTTNYCGSDQVGTGLASKSHDPTTLAMKGDRPSAASLTNLTLLFLQN